MLSWLARKPLKLQDAATVGVKHFELVAVDLKRHGRGQER